LCSSLVRTLDEEKECTSHTLHCVVIHGISLVDPITHAFRRVHLGVRPNFSSSADSFVLLKFRFPCGVTDWEIQGWGMVSQRHIRRTLELGYMAVSGHSGGVGLVEEVHMSFQRGQLEVGLYQLLQNSASELVVVWSASTKPAHKFLFRPLAMFHFTASKPQTVQWSPEDYQVRSDWTPSVWLTSASHEIVAFSRFRWLY
jgi:hypothetical protein